MKNKKKSGQAPKKTSFRRRARKILQGQLILSTKLKENFVEIEMAS